MNSKSPQQLNDLIERFLGTTTTNLRELAAVAELDLERDFIGIDLSGEDFRGNTLAGFNLERADLRNANLSHVDLSNTNLRGANLSHVDLSNANLRGANLSHVDLSNANLRGANFVAADLTNINLAKSSWDRDTQFDAEARYLFPLEAKIEAMEAVSIIGSTTKNRQLSVAVAGGGSFNSSSVGINFEEPLPRSNVIGFPVSALSFDQQVSTILEWAGARLSKVVCVSNVHMLMEGHWHSDFSTVLSKADLLTPDGMPLVWVASLMKGSSQERVAGMELMQSLCQQAEVLGISVFLFGSTSEILLKIKEQLAKEFPSLKIAGMVSPPFRPLSVEEDKQIVDEVNQSGAGLVFVSLGCPKQERWMGQHRGEVKAVMVGLGGAFNVYAGIKQWAPAWVRDNGLEWLYRLAHDPRRLWKRYARTIPPFMFLVLKQIVKANLGISTESKFLTKKTPK